MPRAALALLAIAGDRLALDDGTAAQNRTLVVVDLTTGQMAGTFATFESAQVSGGTARITVVGRKGSRAICRNLSKAELPGARMVGESVIDLSTPTATPTGTTRCVYAA